MTSRIPVMFNACFGGFGLSDAAMTAYRERCPDAGADLDSWGILRHDAVMVEIVRELGDAANDRYAKIRLQRIPAQFVNFYQIDEYDGMETVVLLRNEYKLDAVKSILRDRSLSKADKLVRISAVVNQEEEPSDEECE